jgi:hypothetical protein
MRNTQLIRQWRILVRLRQGACCLSELAHDLGRCERTIRRDLYALQDAGLPITSRWAANEGCEPDPLFGRMGDRANLWTLAEMAEWPLHEPVPTKDLRASAPMAKAS